VKFLVFFSKTKVGEMLTRCLFFTPRQKLVKC
jgi:hypothetical protein